MIHVNIGTNKGSILHVKINRAFGNVHYSLIHHIASEHYGNDVHVQGWALVDAPDYSTHAYFKMIKECSSLKERWLRAKEWRSKKESYINAKIYN